MQAGSDRPLTDDEIAVINAFQGGFPIVADPYGTAAAALTDHGVQIDADTLAATIRELTQDGVLSRFGALINAEAIGGAATLVAMHAPLEHFDSITAAVNSHDAVAHNYEREHPHLNMWFVVSVAEPDEVGPVLDAIAAETGQTPYNLPKQREFRVEAKFPLAGPLAEAEIDLSDVGGPAPAPVSGPLTAADRKLLVEIQDGFPLGRRPYAAIADALDTDAAWVRERLRALLAAGMLRRIGVIPNHYRLGYSHNGMTVWDVPDDAVERVGAAVAELPFVTHCYERPRHAGVWPYNFFAMTHGRSADESAARIDEVAAVMREHFDVDARGWDTLFSSQILKKTGIRIADRLESAAA
jgi:DNA-binding Lrp family transcriptional regulator